MDGAKALALPTKLGQSLEITDASGMDIFWKSFDPQGDIWFEAKFDLFNIDVTKTTDESKADYIKVLLENCIRLNSDFLSKWKKYRIKANLGFNPDWGLGSSSTMISCLAQWAEVDPFDLLEASFGGSGYDIACASSTRPIYYRKHEGHPVVECCDFAPAFKDQLYFVYSGQKQDTIEGIAHYREQIQATSKDIDAFSSMAEKMATASKLSNFESVLEEHDDMLSQLLRLPRMQSDQRYQDYWGRLKPLGAWGGDFFLATSAESDADTRKYFSDKGHDHVFSYDELILSTVETNAKEVA